MPDRLRAQVTALVAVLSVGVLASPAGAAPDVALAGDSIAERAGTQIRNAIEPQHDVVWYETQNSATIRRVGNLLLDRVRRPGGPDIVLVELGVGNAFWGTATADFRKQVRYLTRELLEEVNCVRWFEQKETDLRGYRNIEARAPGFNAILRAEVHRFRRARTVHYGTWARVLGPAGFTEDTLHLTPRGKRGMARLARQAVDGCDPAVTSGPFWDVPDRHWAATEIDWVGDRHLIDGFGNGTYRADLGGIVQHLDRVDWIRALWRRLARPGGYGAAPWPDAGGRDGPPLAWAWGEEVTAVDGDSPFRPGAPVSRADAVQWLYRSEGRPDPSGYPDHGLTDVPPGISRAVRWAKGIGVIRVPDGGRFEPRRPVSRAEAAVFLHRFAHAPPPPAPAPVP